MSPPEEPPRLPQRLRAEALDVAEGVAEALRWLRQRPAHVWLRLLLLVLGLWLWSWAAGTLPRGFFASPSETLRAFGDLLHDYRSDYGRAVADTLAVFLGGLGLAALAGIPLGLLLGAAPLLGRTFNPFLNALAATPLIALMPLVILWLGLGQGAKMTIVALGAVMPILINSYTGMRSVDPALTEMARAHAVPPWRRLVRIALPAALHPVMAGLRLGAAAGLVTAVIADIYMSMTGLGALLIAYGNSFRMGPYLVVVLTLAAIGVGTTALLALAELLLTPRPARRRLFP